MFYFDKIYANASLKQSTITPVCLDFQLPCNGFPLWITSIFFLPILTPTEKKFLKYCIFKNIGNDCDPILAIIISYNIVSIKVKDNYDVEMFLTLNTVLFDGM